MPLSATIIVEHGYAIVTQNTTSGIVPNSGALMGTVVAAEWANPYVTVGDAVMYISKDAYQFETSSVSYRVVPLTSILLRIAAVS